MATYRSEFKDYYCGSCWGETRRNIESYDFNMTRVFEIFLGEDHEDEDARILSELRAQRMSDDI